MDGVVLEDNVLRLRPLTLEDVDEWIAGEDDEQIRWFEFARPAHRDDVVQAIERWQDSWRSGGAVRQWAVCAPPTGRIVGGVELRDLGNGEANLSYVVFPGFRRAGLATRASHLARCYASREMGARVAVYQGPRGELRVYRRCPQIGRRRVRHGSVGCWRHVRFLPARSCRSSVT